MCRPSKHHPQLHPRRRRRPSPRRPHLRPQLHHPHRLQLHPRRRRRPSPRRPHRLQLHPRRRRRPSPRRPHRLQLHPRRRRRPFRRCLRAPRRRHPQWLRPRRKSPSHPLPLCRQQPPSPPRQRWSPPGSRRGSDLLARYRLMHCLPPVARCCSGSRKPSEPPKPPLAGGRTGSS